MNNDITREPTYNMLTNNKPLTRRLNDEYDIIGNSMNIDVGHTFEDPFTIYNNESVIYL